MARSIRIRPRLDAPRGARGGPGLWFLMAAIPGCYSQVDALAPIDAGPSADVAPARDAPPDAPPDTGVDAFFPRPECGEPGTMLVVPSTVMGEISGPDRLGSEEGASCWGTAGGEAHHILRVTRRQGVRIRMTGDVTAIAIRRGCSRADEVACAHPSTGGYDGVLDPGDYEILLDTWSPETYRYTLTVEAYDAAENAVCEGALAIPPGGLTGQDSRRGGRGGLDTCVSSSFSDLYFYVDVPAGTAIDLQTTTTSSGEWRAGVTLTDRCRPTSGDCQYFTSGTIREDASYANAGAASERLYVVGTSSRSGDGGVFDIGYVARPIAAHGYCASALDLDGMTVVPTQDGRAAGRRGGAPGFIDERVYYYRVTVGPRQRVRARVTRILTPGGPDLVGMPYPTWSTRCGGEPLAEAVNASDGAATFWLAMAWSIGGRPPQFDFELTRIPLAEHATCDRALALAPGATTTPQTLSSGGSGASACAPADTGSQLWYETTVPAGATVDVTATITASEGTYPYAIIRRLSGCDPMTCEGFAGDPGTGGGPASTTIALDNRASSLESRFLYAITLHDLTGPLADGEFQVATSLPR